MAKKDKQSPFNFGQIVTHGSKDFIDREEERTRMALNIRSGINTVLISPRRWGKSSLVRTVAEDMSDEKGIIFCFMDLFTVSKEADFIELYTRSLIEVTATKAEEAMTNARQFLKGIQASLSFSTDPFHEWKLSFDQRQLEGQKEGVFDLAQRIAAKKKIRLVVCIDEFQNIAEFPKSAELLKKLRAVWQHHDKVSYVLYGSKRHMMDGIFQRSSRPFYRFGDVIQLPRLPEKDLMQFLVRAFKRTKKNISKEQAKEIVQLMENHPYYVQQLAHLTWMHTSEEVSKSKIKSALKNLLTQNALFYEHEVEHLSRTQINFLKALSAGEQKFSAQKVMAEYDLGSSSNIVKVKRVLREKEIIDEQEGIVQFLDPAFKMWFAQRMMR